MRDTRDMIADLVAEGLQSTAGTRRAAAPRIPPGSAGDIGRVNALFARGAALVTGGRAPNIFTTLGRHRRLFRRWLPFAGALMPRGVLPRADTELVILRVAHNTGCDYEWHHHERIARTAGLERDDVERVREGQDAPGWSDRQRLLLRTADELHADRVLSDATWDELRPLYSDRELIELCMLVGHYEMLAMTLNTLRVQPDELGSGPPEWLARVTRRARR